MSGGGAGGGIGNGYVSSYGKKGGANVEHRRKLGEGSGIFRQRGMVLSGESMEGESVVTEQGPGRRKTWGPG